MGRGRPHELNGGRLLSSVPEPEAMSPVDFPIPVLVCSVFGFRVSTNAERDSFTLRVTPLAPIGPDQYAPCTDHHQDTVFDEPNMLVLMEHFVNCMNEQQRNATRAMLSNITIPPAIEPS